MVNAVIRMRDALNGYVRINGHAKDARICAAVSALTGAAMNVMGDAVMRARYESGDVDFDVMITNGQQMGALDTLAEGLEMLAEKFPQEVGVTIETDDPVYFKQTRGKDRRKLL